MKNVAMITIVGNVGRDPEARGQGDREMVGFSVAVNTRRGERESTAWYRVACWGGLAGIARDYVRKGNPVMVFGALEARLVEGRDKQPVLSLDVNARELVLLSGAAPSEAGERPAAPGGGGVKRTPGGRIVPADEPDLEELPF